MKHNFLRWCINWLADTNKPKWLRSAIGSDRELHEYEAEMAFLARRLREDAAPWADRAVSAAHEANVNVSRGEARRRQRNRGRRRVQIAIAACVVIVVVASRFNFSLETAEKSVVETSVEADVEGVREEITALVAVWSDSVQNVEDSVVSFSNSVIPTSLEYADAESIRNAMIRPVESASRRYGQTLAFVEQNARILLSMDSPYLSRIPRPTDRE